MRRRGHAAHATATAKCGDCFQGWCRRARHLTSVARGAHDRRDVGDESGGGAEHRAQLDELLARHRAVLVADGGGGSGAQLVLGTVGAAVFVSIAGARSADEILQRVANAVGAGSRAALPPMTFAWDGAERADGAAIADAVKTFLRRSRAGKVVVLSPMVLAGLELPTLDVSASERVLAATPAEPEALLRAARSAARAGDGRRALELIATHDMARAAAEMAALEHVLHEIAAVTPPLAVESHLLAAEEKLRRGDFHGALHVLDGVRGVPPDGPLHERWRRLRADALTRAGEPVTAQRELEGVARPADPNIAIAMARITLLRGEVLATRASLRALRPATREQEAHRLGTIGWSYVFEERYERALVLARAARAIYREAVTGALDPLLKLVEVLALLGVGEIDAAAALVEREGATAADASETFGRGLGLLLRAAILWRRGDFDACLEAAKPTHSAFGARSDQMAVALCARFFVRAAAGLGRFALAEEYLRIAFGVAGESSLSILMPACAREAALFAEARGDRDEAVRQIGRATPGGSPYARLDAQSLTGQPIARSSVSSAVRAYAELRIAERALEQGRSADALAAAERAAAWYREKGVRFELARTHLLRAEASFRLGQPGPLAAADSALDACEAIASSHQYRPLSIACALVRAARADRSGDAEQYRRCLAQARDCAPELVDEALARACARVGLDARAHPEAAAAFSALVARLELDRPVVRRARTAGRVYLQAETDPIPGDVVVHVERGIVDAAGEQHRIPRQPLELLALLAESAGAGASAEQIYLTLTGARTYHPIRHRANVHVAVGRLRTALAAVLRRFEGDPIERTEDGYRLATGLSVTACREGPSPRF
jgi:tetratricopeptide (TPR) repeat protein